MLPAERASRLATDLTFTVGHDEMVAKIRHEIEEALWALLSGIGDPGECKRCHQQLIWVYHSKTGKTAPYSRAGINHFIDCPDASFFRKKK